MGLLSDLTGGAINDNGPLIPGVDNPFQSSQTVWLPGAGGLNPLNSQSAVGQLTKDIGQLNPFNPDSTAGKVVNNIGKDMSADPAKWVAIAAAVATGQVQLIPYINGVAALTKKNSTPEEWLTEGVKAAAIQMGGEWVANNIGGVGPQTDITTGETFAGTGAAGATGSAQVGIAAGNIARNIFATAARKGSTDINSAQIVTGAITSEALNEAFKYLPGFDGLSKGEQTAAVNAFKTAFNKDSNAAYQLFNQGFDATIKGLNTAAQFAGYKDLNEQNAVNNFVIAGGNKDDIENLANKEKASQDAYAKYEPENQKLLTWNSKLADYNSRLDQLNNHTVSGPQAYAIWRSLNDDYPWFQDSRNIPDYNKVLDLWDKYTKSWNDSSSTVSNYKSYIDQGWVSLAQQKAAAAAGYTTPEAYDTYLADKRAQEDAAAAQAEIDRIARETAAANESARQAAIDEQNRLDAAEAERRANDEAERLRLAGLEEKKDVDLNKVVAGTDAGVSKDFISSGAGGGAEGLGTEGSSEDADQANRVAEFGKDLTGGGAQDLGVKNTDTDFYDPNASSTGAYKYDPTSGTYTYTSDDGSTLTLDADGNIVGSTEATDTSWTGLTDTATGNLKLPKLPGGITPSVKAPVKKVATTTTGAGNTAITSGSSTVVQASGNTAVQTSGGLNVPALLAIMSQFGQQPQQQVQQTQEPGQDFEYFDWAADPFAPKTKEKTNPTGQPKMAHGGSIDELLEILRRSGI